MIQCQILRERGKYMKRQDLTGQTFGKWTVLKYSHSNLHGTYWTCRCQCGRERTVQAGHLKYGKTKGCRFCSSLTRLHPGQGTTNWIFYIYKRSAARRKYTWALSKEFFLSLIGQPCHYCGAPPMRTYRSGACSTPKTYNGIDRKINFEGYTEDNCVTCCFICNRAKRDLTYEEFVQYLQRVKSFLLQSEAKSGTL